MRDTTVITDRNDSVVVEKRDFRPMDALDSLATLDLRSKDRIWSQAVSAARNSRSMFSFDESQAKKCAQPALPQQGRMAQEIGASGDDHHLLPDRSTAGAIVRRGGLGMPIVISVIFFVIYYIISSSGEKMAKEGTWEAFYGTWLSAFVLAPVAIYLTYKATNDSGLLDVDWYVVKFKKIKEKISGIFARFAHIKQKIKQTMKNEKVLNTIEEAIEDFRQGKSSSSSMTKTGKNEGDFIIAAEKVTPEIVNFMLKNGRGVLCAPLSEERCAQLELNMMEPNNTSLLGTPFTVTVDLLGEGCTTGVSIHDRAATLRALADPKTKPSDLGRRGTSPAPSRQRRRSAPSGTYRSRRGPGSTGRAATRRSTDRDHERRRFDGPPAATARSGGEYGLKIISSPT